MLEKPTDESNFLLCEVCNKESQLKDWVLVEDSVYCEICGEHDGLKCPVCGAIHDYIFPRIHLFKQ